MFFFVRTNASDHQGQPCNQADINLYFNIKEKKNRPLPACYSTRIENNKNVINTSLLNVSYTYTKQ